MKNDSIGKKKRLESQFEKWFTKRKKRKKLYAGVFPTLERYYKENKELEKSKMYIIFLLRNKILIIKNFIKKYYKATSVV